MHFFIDYQQLPVQSPTDSFGPDTTNPTTKYNVTSKFRLTTETKAFACQDGMMIVQQSEVDSALVNIILKPSSVGLIHKKVAYYIYRGISKNSLISGTNIAAKNDTTNTDLIKRIYNAKAGEDNYSATILGFDNNSIDATKHIEYLFSNSTNVRPINVKEGEWFGNFTSGSIGFEVISEPDKINVDLEFVRRENTSIDVMGASGFEQSSKRQQILSFIDPSAFFALNANNSSFSSVLEKFSTKDRLYIDIRSEKGYSYNFYQNYNDGNGNSLKLSNSPQSYQTQGWPIILIDRTTNSDINIKLRLDDNLKPILFVENKSVKKTDSGSNFSEIKDDNTGWTNTVTFSLPDASVYGYYLKLCYFHQIINSAATSPFIKENRYYNSAFCPIDLPNLADTSIIDKWAQNPNYNYVAESLQLNGSGNFGYVADNGACWDSNRILFYSNSFSQYKNSGKLFIPGSSKKILLANSIYKNTIQNNLDIICQIYQKKTDTNQYDDIKILTINSYTGYKDNKNIESGLFLGLSMSEILAIKAASSNITGNHHKYIFLEATIDSPLHNQDDVTKDYFFEYKIKVQGLDANGNLQYTTPKITIQGAEQEILVYSHDNFFFNSKEFSAVETQTIATKQAEFHIYPDGRIIANPAIQPSNIGSKIAYIYHYKNEQLLVCELTLIQINMLADGRKKDSSKKVFTSIPPGYKKSVDGIPGENAPHTYYYYENKDIWVKSNDDGTIIFYKSLNKEAYMVKFSSTKINHIIIDGHVLNITDETTSRHFMNPTVTAAFLGAAIELIRFKHFWNGSAYSNGTCSPSVEHASGLAFDMRYQHFVREELNKMANTPESIRDNTAVITAMKRFHFTKIYVGENPRYKVFLTIPSVRQVPKHDNHIHISKLSII